MVVQEWNNGLRVLGMYLNGRAIAGVDATGQRIEDDDFIVYFNGGPDPVEVTLPGPQFGDAWDVVIDTAADAPDGLQLPAASGFRVEARSTVVLIGHSDAGPHRPVRCGVGRIDRRAVLRLDDQHLPKPDSVTAGPLTPPLRRWSNFAAWCHFVVTSRGAQAASAGEVSSPRMRSRTRRSTLETCICDTPSSWPI